MDEAKYACNREDEDGNYLFRLEIPDDLQEIVNKRVIRRSMKAKDDAGAAEVAAGFAAEYEEIFQKLRGDKGRSVDAGIFSYVLYCLRDQV